MATATKKKKGNQISKMIKAAKTKYVSIPEYLIKSAIKEAHLRDDSNESDTPDKVHSKIDSLINTIALISPKDKGRVSCIMYQYIVENNVEIAKEHRIKLVEGITSNMFYLKKMLSNFESDNGNKAYHDFMDYVSDDDAFTILEKVITKASTSYYWRSRSITAQRLVDGDANRVSVFLATFMKCMLTNPERTVDTILTARSINSNSPLCYRRAASLSFLLIYMLNGFNKITINPVRSYASKTILYPEHHVIYKTIKDDINTNHILGVSIATYSKRMDAVLKVLDPKHAARIQKYPQHEHRKRPLPLKYHKKLMKMLQYIGDNYVVITDAKGKIQVHPEIVSYMLDDNLPLPAKRRSKSGQFKVQTERMTGFLSVFGYTYEINVSVDIEKQS